MAIGAKTLSLFSRISEDPGFTAESAHKDFGHVKRKQVGVVPCELTVVRKFRTSGIDSKNKPVCYGFSKECAAAIRATNDKAPPTR